MCSKSYFKLRKTPNTAFRPVLRFLSFLVGHPQQRVFNNALQYLHESWLMSHMFLKCALNRFCSVTSLMLTPGIVAIACLQVTVFLHRVECLFCSSLQMMVLIVANGTLPSVCSSGSRRLIPTEFVPNFILRPICVLVQLLVLLFYLWVSSFFFQKCAFQILFSSGISWSSCLEPCLELHSHWSQKIWFTLDWIFSLWYTSL